MTLVNWIGGNVQVDGADSVDLRSETRIRLHRHRHGRRCHFHNTNHVHTTIVQTNVDGNVQIKNTVSDRGSVDVIDVVIGGDLQYQDNRYPLDASGNTIGGNLQLYDNDSSGGRLIINGNVITGDLDCVGNTAAGLPIAGNLFGTNTVGGQKTGQCVGN